MDTTTAISTVIAIAAVICMFLAAPIVFAVSAPLAYMLWIIGGFYGLGVFAMIVTSYRD